MDTDAATSALLAPTPLPTMLTNALTPASLALTAHALVLADLPTPAVFAATALPPVIAATSACNFAGNAGAVEDI